MERCLIDLMNNELLLPLLLIRRMFFGGRTVACVSYFFVSIHSARKQSTVCQRARYSNDPTPRVSSISIAVTYLERLGSQFAFPIRLSTILHVLFEGRVFIIFFFFTVVSDFSRDVKDSIRTVLPKRCPRPPVILFVQRRDRRRDWLFESSHRKRIILTSVFVCVADLIAYDSATIYAWIRLLAMRNENWREQRTKDFFCPGLCAVSMTTFSLSLSLLLTHSLRR